VYRVLFGIDSFVYKTYTIDSILVIYLFGLLKDMLKKTNKIKIKIDWRPKHYDGSIFQFEHIT